MILVPIENLSIGTGIILTSAFGESEDTSSTVSAIEASAAYTIGNHELSAGVAVELADSVGFSFPVSYKYSF